MQPRGVVLQKAVPCGLQKAAPHGIIYLPRQLDEVRQFHLQQLRPISTKLLVHLFDIILRSHTCEYIYLHTCTSYTGVPVQISSSLPPPSSKVLRVSHTRSHLGYLPRTCGRTGENRSAATPPSAWLHLCCPPIGPWEASAHCPQHPVKDTTVLRFSWAQGLRSGWHCFVHTAEITLLASLITCVQGYHRHESVVIKSGDHTEHQSFIFFFNLPSKPAQVNSIAPMLQ